MSRYAQPGTRHDLQRIDINASVASAVNLARRALRDDRVEIQFATGPAAEILAKSEEIQQVIFNVVRNAIQAIAGRGVVAIHTGREGGCAAVRIEDSGKGIPVENMKRIFDPFFTTKGPDEGEGLGLYIVRQIVTRYGGTIDVGNAAGGGARFSLRFPLADPKKDEGGHA